MNIRNSTEDTRYRYDRIARFYDIMSATQERMFGPLRRRMWSLAGGRILEIGVGTGRNISLYPAGSQITAIDLSPKMLEQARMHAESLGKDVDLQIGDVQRLHFEDQSFDTVVATCVFCSVPDPLQGLRELRRVLRPGGKIILIEHVRIDRPIWGWIMDRLNPILRRLTGANINRRTVETVRKAGIEITRLESFGIKGMIKFIVGH